MPPNRSDLWAKWLWAHYFPQIETGEPFYLAADGNLILDLVRANASPEISLEIALQDFHEACFSLLERSSSKVRIREKTFNKVPSEGFSCVICLAVQQVLIVELMLNDEHFSEQSYFPRYRACLGLSETNEHLNPLGSAGFQDVWNTLELEIKAVKGSSLSSVTFFAGTGRDLNRKLPFSQALFTTHDLTIIREKSGSIGQQSDDGVTLQGLYRIRNYLGPRAQRLISTSDSTVRTRLCKQVQSFFQNYDRISALRPRTVSTATNSYFVGFLDTEDLFDETFSIYHRSEEGQQDGPPLEVALRNYFQTNRILMLAAQADSYLQVSRKDPIVQGDALLAIVKRDLEEEFKAEIVRIYKSSGNSIFEKRSCNLPRNFSVLFCDSAPDSALNSLVGISSTTQASIPTLELLGGLLANTRSRIFLRGYPPKVIKHKGSLVDPNSSISVDGKPIRCGEFLVSLELQIEFRSFLVQIGTDKIDFAISPHNALDLFPVQYGYLLEKGAFSPCPIPLDNDQAGLRGTFLKNDVSSAKANSREWRTAEILAFLGGKQRRLPLSNTAIRVILEELGMLDETKLPVSLVMKEIQNTKSVPLNGITVAVLKKLSLI